MSSVQRVTLWDDTTNLATSVKGSATDPSVTTEYGAANIATSQATAPTGTAGSLVSSRTTRKAVTIMNLTGTQKIWVGGSGVTTTTGVLIPAVVGASITIPFTGAVFGVSETAAQTVSILETY